MWESYALFFYARTLSVVFGFPNCMGASRAAHQLSVLHRDLSSVTALWVYDPPPKGQVSWDWCWLFSFATNKELFHLPCIFHPTPSLYKAVPAASGTICEACLIILAFTSIPVNIVWRQGIYYWGAILQHTTQLFIAGWHKVQDHDLWKALTLP